MPPEPKEQNGPITGYNIFVKGVSEPTKHFKVSAGMMSYNATGLMPYTNYTFQIQALNVMGVGPNSSTVMNTTFQAGKSISFIYLLILIVCQKQNQIHKHIQTKKRR